VPTPDWRARVVAEDREQERLLNLISDSARKRAAALEDGVRELGTREAVAEDLGIDSSAVRRSILRYGTGTLRPGRTPKTTE
jgi:hypothetical protein